MALLSWGANSHGQLGTGTTCESSYRPERINLKPYDFFAHDISFISGGGSQTYVGLEDGSLYGCGLNTVGQLGKTQDRVIPALTKIFCEYKFVQVSSKWETAAGITPSNRVYVWGSNSFGQLGIPKNNCLYSLTPLDILPDEEMLKVCCGIRHTLVLTTNGEVYSAGDFRKGQLGRKYDSEFCNGFHLVPDLNKVRDIACGQNHCLAITWDNKLYGWGCNKFGQLGLDASQPLVMAPTRIPLPGNPLSEEATVHAGWYHSAVLTGDGRILNWGRNSYCQLGRKTGEIGWDPKYVDLKKVKQLHVGSQHTLAIQDDGSLLTWGWNEHGSCGHFDVDLVAQPTPVRLPGSAVLAGVGSGHSFVVVQL